MIHDDTQVIRSKEIKLALEAVIMQPGREGWTDEWQEVADRLSDMFEDRISQREYDVIKFLFENHMINFNPDGSALIGLLPTENVVNIIGQLIRNEERK